MAAVLVAAAILASLREMLSRSVPKGLRMKGRMPRGAISKAATATVPSVDAGASMPSSRRLTIPWPERRTEKRIDTRHGLRRRAPRFPPYKIY
jgi:hypothetical protein